jgi:hypothetical protein
MTPFDLTPLFRSTIGYDHLANMLDSVSQSDASQNYPPYNIERTSYNFFHITDPFWGCVTTVNPRSPFYFAETLLVLVVIAAAGVFFLNLLYIIPEIRHVRIAPPRRVEEEELELAAVQHPAQVQPASPWD